MDNIVVYNESVIEPGDTVCLHFEYDNNLKLKELVELLDLTNKAINSINKDKGISSNSVLGKKYSTEVKNVQEGSIVLNLVLQTASSIAISLLASYIYDKIKTIGFNKKSKKTEEYKYPILISVNDNRNIYTNVNITNNITIHIYNKIDD